MEGKPDYDPACRLWYTRYQMATLIGRSVKRIDQLRQASNFRFDHVEDGRLVIYSPGFIAFWLGNVADRDDQRRLLKAQADLAEAKLAKLRASHIAAEEVQADYAAVGGVLRHNLKYLCPCCRELLGDGLNGIKELRG